jgi:hypothetical protein
VKRAKKVKALSDHRTESDAVAALCRAAETIVKNGKADRFSVKVEPTGDEFIPWAVFLYER